MPIENGQYVYRGLDLTEGEHNSLGQPTIGRVADTTQYALDRDPENDEQTWYNTLGIGGDENTETLIDGVADSFQSGGNWGYDIYKSQERAMEHEVDPEFDAQAWVHENRKRVPDEYLGALGRTASAEEAEALLTDIEQRRMAQQRVQRMGIGGQITAGLIAGIVDVDTILSGGTLLLGKAGLATTRVGRIALGASTTGGGAALGTAASPEEDYADVALAALLGGGIHGIIGGKADPLAKEVQDGIQRGIDDLDEVVTKRNTTNHQVVDEDMSVPSEPFRVDPIETAEVAGETASRKAATFDPSELTEVADEATGSSVGAKQVSSSELNIEKPSRTVEHQIAMAKQYVKDNELEDKYFYDYGEALDGNSFQKGAAKTVRTTVDTLGRLGLGTDFDKMFKSNSATAKMVAHSLLSDGSARLTNVRSAVHIKDTYQNKMNMLWFEPYQDATSSYLKRQNISMLNLAERNRKIEEFNKQLIFEQENLRLEGAYSKNADPDVIRAATAVNDLNKYDLKVGKKTDIPGYRDIPDSEGYFSRKVTTRSMDSMMRKYKAAGTPISEKMIRQMWKEYYHQMSGLTVSEADKVAGMVMARARTAAEGSSTSLIEMLSENGDEFLRSALKNQGMDDSSIERVVGSLVGKSDERGKAGFMKGRIEGDVRFQASNGLRVLDFIDTDVEGIMTSRVRRTSGRAALAEKGIRTRHDIQTIKDAILYEQRKAFDDGQKLSDVKNAGDLKAAAEDFINADTKLDGDYLDVVFDHFMGDGKITDTSMAAVSRIKRMAVLSTMSGLGLTQLAETGGLIGAFGFKKFMSQLPAAVKNDLKNPRSDLIKELHSMAVLIPEERLWNPRIAAELDQSLHAKSEIAQYYDQLSGIGLRAQGVISGMNKVRYAQQKMAMMVTMDKAMQAIAGVGDDALSAARLRTIGLDDKLITRLRGVTQHIEWDGSNVKKLNVDKWGDEQLVEDFSRSMQIATDQLVQKARLGESNVIFAGNGVTSLMTQFLSYPITAITKQAARNAYVGDQSAALQVLYGFLAAGTVGMAKNIVAGRYDQLDMENFARQGFVMANITGWVPMVADPLLRMIGQEDLAFNPYGDIVRTPPAIDVLNRTLISPSAIGKLLTGDTSNSNLRDLKYTPLIGNWYGTTALINRL